MVKYRKRPVVIEAEQYDASAPEEVRPYGVCLGGTAGCIERAHVHTISGPVGIADGDWIVTGVKGEKYPCRPDVFALTYEEVVADDVPSPEPLRPIQKETP